MELRRTHWLAAIKLAAVVSGVAAAVALALSAFGNVSQTAMVIAVIVVGFALSWVRSGQQAGTSHPGTSHHGAAVPRATFVGHDEQPAHRVATIRVHH